MNDCRAVVVSDTREIFDGVEKGFGFTETEEELTQRTRRGSGGGHREEEGTRKTG
jgi:hypothetical protein